MGGFGAGKTKALVWDVVDRCMATPGHRIALLRDTMGDLQDSTMQTFFEECPAELIYVYRRKDAKVIMQNGSEVLFRSFRAYKQSPRNQNESKIKSLNLGGFGVDEANEITKAEFLMLHGRLRLDTVRDHFGALVTNPPNKDHWIYELFASDKADKSKYALIQASSRENPFLPPDFIPNLEKEYPPGWVKKFVDGEFGFMVTGDPVYEGFKKEWHCKPVKWQKHYGAVHRYWDFGWHRPAVVWAQVTPDLVWKIYKEYMGYQTYIQYFAPKVIDISNKMFPGAKFLDFCDPAGTQITDKTTRSTIQILQEDFGIRMQYRFSLITEGVDLVQKKITSTACGEPALQIHPEECPILVTGFEGGYARAKVSDGKGMMTSEPIKDGYFEHLHDALRYGAVNVFGSHSGRRESHVQIPSPSWGERAVGIDQQSINRGGMQGWQERTQ